jgi:hypothetical protein
MSDIAERIRRRSLTWITKKLARRTTKFQRSYLSGDTELS